MEAGHSQWSGGEAEAGPVGMEEGRAGRGLWEGAGWGGHCHPPQSLPASLVGLMTYWTYPRLPTEPGHHQPGALQRTGAWRVSGERGPKAATALLWGCCPANRPHTGLSLPMRGPWGRTRQAVLKTSWPPKGWVPAGVGRRDLGLPFLCLRAGGPAANQPGRGASGRVPGTQRQTR